MAYPGGQAPWFVTRIRIWFRIRFVCCDSGLWMWLWLWVWVCWLIDSGNTESTWPCQTWNEGKRNYNYQKNKNKGSKNPIAHISSSRSAHVCTWTCPCPWQCVCVCLCLCLFCVFVRVLEAKWSWIACRLHLECKQLPGARQKPLMERPKDRSLARQFARQTTNIEMFTE